MGFGTRVPERNLNLLVESVDISAGLNLKESAISHANHSRGEPHQPAALADLPVNGTSPRSMVSAEVLKQRPSRPPDYAVESQAIMALAQSMAVAPEGILQRPAVTALTLCRAHSAGLSLLEEGDLLKNFHWRAIAGQWAEHANGGTPRDFGPCGTVLDRNAPQICSHPEVDFPPLQRREAPA